MVSNFYINKLYKYLGLQTIVRILFLCTVQKIRKYMFFSTLRCKASFSKRVGKINITNLADIKFNIIIILFVITEVTNI